MAPAATIKGVIKAVSISTAKGTKKSNVPSAELQTDFGIAGDAHAGKWHRQVSLLAAESIDKMKKAGADVAPGDFAENITTEGIDLCSLELGDKLKIAGGAVLEITQFGKKCHSHCEIFKLVGDCIMPREGIFARVLQGGPIKAGDTIEVIDDQDSDTDGK